MDRQKERFYHAQAAKLDLRRKWQNMALWPLVARFGDRLKLEFEYQYANFRIDLYIPALKLAVEIDEPFHDKQAEADARRANEITCGLDCEFVRIRVADERGLFQQIEELSSEIGRRIEQTSPPEWTISLPRSRGSVLSLEGTYGERNLAKLRATGVPELVEGMKRDLGALEIEVSDDLGPVIPSNGEMGFTAMLPGVKFCVSIRANLQAKLLVTEFTQAALDTLQITVDGPKNGRTPYWVINEFVGRHDVNDLTGKLGIFKQMIET